MSIEEEIFFNTRLNDFKLTQYGFKEKWDNYFYSAYLIENFKVDIVVSKEGVVKGKIFDLIADFEYTNFRILQASGLAFKVKDEYIKILKDIRKNCFEKDLFITNQANRITNLINKLYKDEPEFLWKKFPGFGVFRNENTLKWYAIIMNIDKRKLGDFNEESVEILNVKLNFNNIISLLGKNGFFEAYHMNKKNWISIILDESLSDEEIMGLIKESYELSKLKI